MTIVRRLAPGDASACDAIIARLPYFFGIQAGIDAAASAVREKTGWVTEDDGHVTGFLTLEWALPQSAEIGWLAIDPPNRRGGRGRLLVETAASFALDRGARMLYLFTSASADPQDVLDGYEGTRRFYEALGFVGLWIGRQEGWSQDHLLMVRSLEAARTVKGSD